MTKEKERKEQILQRSLLFANKTIKTKL